MKRPIRRPKNKQGPIQNKKAATPPQKNGNNNNANNNNNNNNNGGLLATLTAQYNEVKNLLKSSKRIKRPANANNQQDTVLEAKLAEIDKQIKAVTAENDNYRKDAEYRKLAEEKLAEEKHLANIDKRVEVMVERGIIASGDADTINNWKNLYKSNFDSTDALVKAQLSKLPQKDKPDNNRIQTHQSIREVAGQMAGKYLSGDKSVFDAKLK